MSVKIGDKINDRYRIVSRIAQGGMAEVYEAFDSKEKRQCAIKFILEDLLKDEENVLRFSHEANVMMKLHHPNICEVYETGIYKNRPYIIFEFIKGQTLGEKLKLGSKITYIEACEIMIQMCEVLTYIHNRSIIHRDIKPDNIYYSYDGTVKLSDFGIALDLTNKTPMDLTLVGSVHYLAPEICQCLEVTKQSDIYSLGITFYELVTKKLPYVNDDPVEVAVSQVKDRLPKPSDIAKDLPKPIEKIIYKATMKHLVNRYQTAGEMHQDLLNVLSNKSRYRKRRGILEKLLGFIGD